MDTESAGVEQQGMTSCAESFEALARANGYRFWLASDLARLLGYTEPSALKKAINRAIAACATLNIPVHENFEAIRGIDGQTDHKLTRFACYLVAMNGDVRKPGVAAAQAYLATLAESMRRCMAEAENVERVTLRGEMTEREKSLAGVAKSAGVEVYAFFQNAGYRGMYNRGLRELVGYKGLPEGKSLLDYMGWTELAANLFRITQTEEKIRNEGIAGQRPLESAAEQVGRKVRSTMIEISGTPPEDLPLADDIREVRGDLKQTQRKLSKMDKPVLPPGK